MDFIARLQDDFSNSIFRDVGTFDVILIVIMCLPLIVTFFSARIAAMFVSEADAKMTLSLKIKLISLLIVGGLAMIITQVL